MKKLTDTQKEFYSYLGLLSVKFAKMEYYLSLMISKLIRNDDDLISIMMIEKNNLSQNIDLIKKINLIRGFEEESIKNLLGLISQVKNDRNLFIHGIWGEPISSENDIKIVCEERKIKYEEEKGSGKTWQLNQNHVFRLTYIKSKIVKLDDIIFVQEDLNKKLDKSLLD